MAAYGSDTGGICGDSNMFVGVNNYTIATTFCGLQSFYLPKSTNLYIKYIYIYIFPFSPHPKTTLTPGNNNDVIVQGSVGNEAELRTCRLIKG